MSICNPLGYDRPECSYTSDQSWLVCSTFPVGPQVRKDHNANESGEDVMPFHAGVITV